MDSLRIARPWFGRWLLVWFGVAVGESVAVMTVPGVWENPTFLFGLVVLAASLCVVTSGVVIIRGWRAGLAETSLLGCFFMAVSLLPLAHGITVPGVLFGPNTATMSTVFWAVPLGSIVLVPLVAVRSRVANTVMRFWRHWVVAHLLILVAVFVSALVSPNLIPVPAMASLGAVIGVGFSLLVCLALSYRHLRLAWIAHSPGPLAVSIGAAMVGSSTIVFLGSGPWTTGFWLAHALDIVGVFLATIVGATVYRRSGSVDALLAPVEATTPLRALEMGLDPLVRRFVAALDQKDPITRNHVVRTAHMASLVAIEMGVRFNYVSTITLGALLHDVGKLDVPDAVLNKTGRLNDAEFALIKRHTIDGEKLVAASAALAELAPIVRGHHERIDGGGYPDGVGGDQIPLAARIVSACDGFDAMANTRQYRDGMGADRALAILAEHAGSQWDADVVAAVTRVVRRRAGEFDGDALATVGRDSAADTHELWCGCADALPSALVSTG